MEAPMKLSFRLLPALGCLSAVLAVSWGCGYRSGSPSVSDGPSANAAALTAAPASIFAGSVPSNIALAVQSIELGLKFKSDVDGSITGVRFYKDASNTGLHTGSLWSSTGTLLATTTFNSESASGWQSANFASPVAISANTIYVISYHTDAGHYAGDLGYFNPSGVDNSVLHALSTAAAGGNGVFQLGPTGFPSSVYQNSNYWVDVLFSSAGPPPPPPPPPPGVVAAPPAAHGGAPLCGGRRGAADRATTHHDTCPASPPASCLPAGPRPAVV